MIVLGFDSGAVHVGWCLIDVQSPTKCPMWLAARECHPDHVLQVITESRPDMVVVETPVGELYKGRPSGRNLLESGIVAGEAIGAARALGYRVERFSAPEWRRALFGFPNPSDAEIKAWVYHFVVGVPRPPLRTNTHQRDACGVAVVGSRLGDRHTGRPEPKTAFWRPRGAKRR